MLTTRNHKDTDASDPEYVPHQSAFCIRWSPWHVAAGGSRTAMIAYAGKNHVGFRRVTLAEPWEAERKPVLRVEEADASGMCLFLAADASVHWEDRVSSLLPLLPSPLSSCFNIGPVRY